MSSEVDEIKLKLPIDQVVGEYVQLARAGSSFKARCPFHNEKTPSFHVSPERGVWHCFGCGLGGDLFTFIEKVEGIEFPEALRLLADRAGVKLVARDPVLASKKTRVLDLLQDAGKYYQAVLQHERAGSEARAYLKKRRIAQESIVEFGLGYAPDDWHALTGALSKKGYQPAELETAGLAIGKEGRYYDRFRNRLMFPLANAWGQVIGFAGRALPREGNERKEEAKYINTPETPVYHKSQVLFGLSLAKAKAQELKTMVLVEGYLDVIGSREAGVANVVAPCGTAFTHEQARLIARYADTLLLAFDPDAAGEEATKRALGVASPAGLEVRALALPPGKDPDDVAHDDPEKWRMAVTNAIPAMQFIIERARANADLSGAKGKQKFTRAVLPAVALLHDPVEMSHYLEVAADISGTPAQLLHEEIRRLKKVTPAQGAAAEPLESPRVTSPRRAERVAERLLALAYRFPDDAGAQISTVCAPELFPQGALQELYKMFLMYYNKRTNSKEESEDVHAFVAREGSAELARELDTILFVGERDFPDAPDGATLLQEITVGVEIMRRSHIQHELAGVHDALKKAERAKDPAAVHKYAEQARALAEKLS